MLVLTRKLNESIVINGNIRVTLVAIRGGHVRIGIEAPIEVPVLREELVDPTGPGRKVPGADFTCEAKDQAHTEKHRTGLLTASHS